MIEVIPLKSLNAEITVPGSKYVANRILIISALANGISAIKNLPDNDDINRAIVALKSFGVEIKRENKKILIKGTEGLLNTKKNFPASLGIFFRQIDVGDSGTLMRFITSFAALASGKTKITGSKRILERPVIDLLNSLRSLGIECKSLNQDFPPVVIEGSTLKGGTVRIKGNVSSQFISSLLLTAPYAKEDVEIVVESDLVSKGYVDMTIGLMEQFGVSVERNSYEKFKVSSGQRYIGREFNVSGDWSSANYFLAAAAIIPGTVKINDLDMESKQGESEFADILAKMGCKVEKNRNSMRVIGKNNLKGVDVDMSAMPDAVQTLAVVAAFSDGITRIRNIRHLRFKESDRIRDTAMELKKIGLKAEAKGDELIIKNGRIVPGIIDPHNDHRMAMSFAIIGLKAAGIKIKNPGCVSKSFPGFWDTLMKIGAKIKKIEWANVI